MFRKSLLFGGLIAVLCLSGCSNANELPGYNAKAKHSSADFYKNDLMDSILNEKSIMLLVLPRLVMRLDCYIVLKK